ncbi:hypothetical protein [Alteromonas lipotrueiana]|uniref:hypothetical protein n=1 Tax=Alteromonas lipotrueiana TaxID=2803815 RepID=UPI001C436F18|nr:hypothetical protein [Alteromonas lipotrueiana]
MSYRTYLNPEQKKWLQQHPEEAREQRTELHHQAQNFQLQVDQTNTVEYASRALETAHAIILALHHPHSSSQTIAEDFIAYGALTVYLAARYQDSGDSQAAEQVYADSQQQLMALTPLFATEPEIATLLQSIVHGLSPAASPRPNSGDSTVQVH